MIINTSFVCLLFTVGSVWFGHFAVLSSPGSLEAPHKEAITTDHLAAARQSLSSSSRGGSAGRDVVIIETTKNSGTTRLRPSAHSCIQNKNSIN